MDALWLAVEAASTTAEEGLLSLPPKWKGKGGSKSYLDSYLLNTS